MPLNIAQGLIDAAMTKNTFVNPYTYVEENPETGAITINTVDVKDPTSDPEVIFALIRSNADSAFRKFGESLACVLPQKCVYKWGVMAIRRTTIRTGLMFAGCLGWIGSCIAYVGIVAFVIFLVSGSARILVGFLGVIIGIICLVYLSKNKNKTSTNADHDNIDNEISTYPGLPEHSSYTNAEILKSDMRKIRDYMDVINKSSNIVLVTQRYNDLIDVLSWATRYESDPRVTFTSQDIPSTALETLKHRKAIIMTSAVQRAYNNAVAKSAELKTKEGRKKRLIAFCDLLTENMSFFPAETQEYVTNLIHEIKNN
jgi:hypothetical protein